MPKSFYMDKQIITVYSVICARYVDGWNSWSVFNWLKLDFSGSEIFWVPFAQLPSSCCVFCGRLFHNSFRMAFALMCLDLDLGSPCAGVASLVFLLFGAGADNSGWGSEFSVSSPFGLFGRTFVCLCAALFLFVCFGASDPSMVSLGGEILAPLPLPVHGLVALEPIN